MRAKRVAMVVGAVLTLVGPAAAEDLKVSIGLSGWAGYAPLVLARDAGIYRKHGLDVTISDLPEAERSRAVAEGSIQCAGAAVSTWIAWIADGVAAKQILSIDRSFGADGLVARPGIASIKDLKGRTVAVSAPGTSPHFFLSWLLAKAGLIPRDVTLLISDPKSAAEAFMSGQGDAAVTYEPYLTQVRAKADVGTVLTTTLDEPVVGDALGCSTAFLADHPDGAKALADSFFEALDLIGAEPVRSYERIGKLAGESGTEFGEVAQFLKWQDRYANQVFFGSDFPAFARDAGKLLLQTGVTRRLPDLPALVDARFIQ